jgi:hypothetical protein
MAGANNSKAPVGAKHARDRSAMFRYLNALLVLFAFVAGCAGKSTGGQSTAATGATSGAVSGAVSGVGSTGGQSAPSGSPGGSGFGLASDGASLPPPPPVPCHDIDGGWTCPSSALTCAFVGTPKVSGQTVFVLQNQEIVAIDRSGATPPSTVDTGQDGVRDFWVAEPDLVWNTLPGAMVRRRIDATDTAEAITGCGINAASFAADSAAFYWYGSGPLNNILRVGRSPLLASRIDSLYSLPWNVGSVTLFVDDQHIYANLTVGDKTSAGCVCGCMPGYAPGTSISDASTGAASGTASASTGLVATSGIIPPMSGSVTGSLPPNIGVGCAPSMGSSGSPGCTRSTSPIATQDAAVGQVTVVATDTDSLYWTDGTSLARVAKDGSSEEFLLGPQSPNTTLTMDGEGVAVDDSFIYAAVARQDGAHQLVASYLVQMNKDGSGVTDLKQLVAEVSAVPGIGWIDASTEVLYFVVQDYDPCSGYQKYLSWTPKGGGTLEGGTGDSSNETSDTETGAR